MVSLGHNVGKERERKREKIKPEIFMRSLPWAEMGKLFSVDGRTWPLSGHSKKKKKVTFVLFNVVFI